MEEKQRSIVDQIIIYRQQKLLFHIKQRRQNCVIVLILFVCIAYTSLLVC